MLATLWDKLRRSVVVGRALALVWRISPRYVLVNALLSLAEALLPLATLGLTALAIDRIADVLAAPDAAAALADGTALRAVGLLIGGIGAVLLLEAILGGLTNVTTQAQGLLLTDRMTSAIHAQSIAADLAYYENPAYQDTLHMAQQQAPFRPQQIVNALMRLAQSSLTLAGMLAVLFTLHPLVPLLALLAAVPSVLVATAFAQREFAWAKRRSVVERRVNYLNWVMTHIQHAKEMRLFNLGRFMTREHDDARTMLREERIRLTWQRTALEVVARLGTVVAMVLAFVFAARQALLGIVSVGAFVLYFQAFQRAQGLLGSTLSSLSQLYENNLFMKHYYDFMALAPTVRTPDAPRPVPEVLREGVRFHNVTFRYPHGVQNVLEDVSLHIGPQEVVALVGANGAGKTTLIKLLCRLYDPTDGCVTLDGVDLRAYDPDALRERITVVFQDYNHYFMSARANIAVGSVQHADDTARIERAAQLSDAAGVIEALPRGYDTLLGTFYEGGAQLSIGQWQKIALARAFMRDAQLMVLDEPTSALDVEAEHAVFEHFRQMVQGRAAILISHRLSTVRLADRIYVLDGNRIAESGTHDDLLARNGRYAAMFNLQAEAYR